MSFNYTDLLTSIQNQKCALVLGPNACLTEGGVTTFSSRIAKKIQSAGMGIKYYPRDDLYFIPARSDRTKACTLIQNELKNALTNLDNPGFYKKFYQQITELPFHLILSLSPDKFLFFWMKHQGLDPEFAAFQINEPTDLFEHPTVEKPLIFNLFGEASKAESLILTQEDFYKYLNEVFTNSKKLENLRTCLRDIDYLILLGCPLDRWYVKLLMLLLEINSDSRFIAFATNPKKDNLCINPPPQPGDPEILEIEEFCQSHFKIAFAEDNFLKFINNLYSEAANEALKQNPAIVLRTQAGMQAGQNKNLKRTVAISYAPDENSVSIASKIIDVFKAKGYEIRNDKISLSYRGNINDYIEKMSSGEVVITILSDKFLKDKRCMKMALTMEKYQNPEERIFPIVLDDAKIYDGTDQIVYMNYWEHEKAKITQALQTLNDLAYIQSIQEELNLVSDIRRFTNGFLSIINNFNCLTPDIHQGENFSSLISEVEKRFKKDEQIQSS